MSVQDLHVTRSSKAASIAAATAKTNNCFIENSP